MRGIKGIIILIFTSFMSIGLVGCSEKVLTMDEAKEKIGYEQKISDMLLKSAEVFPGDSEKVFAESLKELRRDLEDFFEKSKKSENLEIKDSLKKELKALESTYGGLLKKNYDLQFFKSFFDLEFITDSNKEAIKLLYEKNKSLIENSAICYIDIVDLKDASAITAETIIIEKDRNTYEELNKFYGLSSDKDYSDVYNSKVPKYKEMIDEYYTLDNSAISYLDVKTESEREPIWEEAKKVIESELGSSGKLTFPSSVTSKDITMKKTGSIYIIKSYVDIEKGGSKERKEFTVKCEVSRDYYMLISLSI